MSGWVISENGTTQRQEKNRDQRSSDAFGHLALIVTDMRETLLSFLDDCLARGAETVVVGRRGLRLARWSGGQIAARVFQFARELEARGIERGDRVLFWGENSPEWIAAFFGCLLRGVVVVPLDLKSAPDFVARVQEQVSARLLLTDETQLTLDHHSAAPYTATPISADDLVEIV